MTKVVAPGGDGSTLERSATARPLSTIPPDDLVGRSLLHFRVLARLGAGGMGVVYKAFDDKLRRTIAVKVLGPRYVVDERNKELIFREARSAAGLNHPNIAAIYDLHEAPEGAFYVMELVEGETLRARIGRAKLPIDQVLRWAVQIARALAHAHVAGIVHRDLKSDNVMITRTGEAKLLDFGLAKVVELAEPIEQGVADQPVAHAATAVARGTIGGHGRVLGTPAYMAPEQARGEEVDARADVFAFGVVLYEMLTSVSPFTTRTGVPSGDSTSGDWKVQARVGELAPRVPRAIEALVQRCLAFDRDGRYADGAALVTALESFARRPPRWKRYAAAAAIPLITAGAYVALRSRTLSGSASITYQAKRLTTRGDIGFAALAPNGHQVAALATGNMVLLLDLDAPDQTRVLATDHYSGLSWSSDGSHLMYRTATTIKVIALDGSISNELGHRLGESVVAVGPGSYATWSNNGKEVTLHDLRGDDSHAVRCAVPGTYVFLTNVIAASADDVIYITTRSEDTTDHVYRTDRSCSHIDLIASGLDLTSMAIAADGISLLGIASRKTQPHVVVIDREATRDLPIFVQQQSGVAGQRPDGTVVLTDTSVSWRLVRVALDGAIAELASGVTHNAIEVSPDGTGFARLDTGGCGGGPLAIVEIARPSEPVKPLETTAVGVAWAPDSRRLAVLVAIGDDRAIVIEDADGSHRTSRPITDLAGDGCEEGLGVVWSGPDEVAYRRAGNRTYRRVQLASGATSDLFDASRGWVFDPRRSPVGPALVAWWNRAPAPGLWLVEPGHEDRMLIREDGADGVPSYAWSPTGDAVFVVTADGTTIERVDAATGTTSRRAMLPAERNVDTTSLFVRPDGELIVKREMMLSDLVTETPAR